MEPSRLLARMLLRMVSVPVPVWKMQPPMLEIFSEKVQWMSVFVELTAQRPPPPTLAELLPKVLLMAANLESVKLAMPPPSPAELPLKVLFCTVTVPPSFKRPPPELGHE